MVSQVPPTRFLWTKMQAEAGQSLRDILHRKELESLSGDGVFVWGVGSSIGAKIKYIRAGIVTDVLFSPMLSSPKKIDRYPSSITVWGSYVDHDGSIRPLPANSLVTSRGETALGRKSRHYAIVARSRSPLLARASASINLACYRNIDSKKGRVGNSQVTAVLERSGNCTEGGPQTMYEIAFSAELIYPYFVRLADPFEIPMRTWLDLEEKLGQVKSPDRFIEIVQSARESVAKRNVQNFDMPMFNATATVLRTAF